MKNKFPYYQIHQIIVNNLGWSSENCLGTSEWEECLSSTIEQINFYIWHHLERYEDDIKENNKWIPDSEDELYSLWHEFKHPKRKCNVCGSENVVDILNLCEKCLLKNKKFITLFEKAKKNENP